MGQRKVSVGSYMYKDVCVTIRVRMVVLEATA